MARVEVVASMSGSISSRGISKKYVIPNPAERVARENKKTTETAKLFRFVFDSVGVFSLFSLYFCFCSVVRSLSVVIFFYFCVCECLDICVCEGYVDEVEFFLLCVVSVEQTKTQKIEDDEKMQ